MHFEIATRSYQVYEGNKILQMNFGQIFEMREGEQKQRVLQSIHSHDILGVGNY